LKKAGLVLDWIEEVYSGVWSYNPMDLLPIEGEEYSHVIVQARKPFEISFILVQEVFGPQKVTYEG
jgi:hypothetical protein